MKKPIIIICAFILVVLVAVIGIYGFNYLRLQSQMNDVIKADARNEGIQVSVHYGNYINTSKLVLHLKPIPNTKSLGDAFRVFLQYADRVPLDKFSEDELVYKNKTTPNVLIDQYKLQMNIEEVLANDPRDHGVEILI